MIRSRSTKRAKQEREYAKVRKAFLEDNYECQVHWGIWAVMDDLNITTPYSEEVHHQRGRIGALLTDTRYFLAVCRKCHEWIEKYPEKAKEKGYSISRLSVS